MIISFSTNSNLVGPCSLASLSHARPPCFDRSSIFPGLRRRSYAKQAKLRHYPLANQRFLRSVDRVSGLIISLWNFKNPLDIFSLQIERKRSKEYLVIILAVKESFERFSCLEFIFEKKKRKQREA